MDKSYLWLFDIRVLYDRLLALATSIARQVELCRGEVRIPQFDYCLSRWLSECVFGMLIRRKNATIPEASNTGCVNS